MTPGRPKRKEQGCRDWHSKGSHLARVTASPLRIMGQALLWVLSIYQLIYPLQVGIIVGTLQMRKLREKCLGAHLWPAESSLGQLISSVRERQTSAGNCGLCLRGRRPPTHPGMYGSRRCCLCCNCLQTCCHEAEQNVPSALTPYCEYFLSPATWEQWAED